MAMHRSTRLRRFAIAFVVVLVIAVAVRFARASSEVVPGAAIGRVIAHQDHR